METESLSVALKHVSQAVNLDSSGFQQAAFTKYIQSLQVLIVYLNNIFVSAGFGKMLEKKKDIMQVLSMIHKCSDRISVILNDNGEQQDVPSPSCPKSHTDISETKTFNSKVSAFQKIQNENTQLFKMYKMRLERTNDRLAKTNLNLEFQRRLAENAILAKKKYDVAIQQLQKERMQFMEKEHKKLFENNELTEKESEKRELYSKVLKYVKTETWPCTWKLNSFDLTAYEVAEKIFFKIISCSEHPLTQWLLLVQTNIFRRICSTLKEYKDYTSYLPDLNSELELKYYSIQEHCDCVVIKLSSIESAVAIPTSKMVELENTVEEISSEIRNIIGDALDIFYLIYKSILPDESETICYHVIEKYFLCHLWPNLCLLFRILNLPSECKLSEGMILHQNCDPSKFEIAGDINVLNEFYIDLTSLLRTLPHHKSLVNKLKILVKVCQNIGNCSTMDNGSKRKLGADEIIPVLSYTIVQSRLPQLISECNMLELLFDMKYLLGEEGYALSSFLASLKCIEIMKLTECEN